MATAVLTRSQAEQQERTTQVLPARRHVILLLVLIAISCLAIEAGSAVFVGRVSRILRRFDAQRAEALQVRKSGAASLSVLLVGNSLLQQGIDLAQLQAKVGSSAHLTRYAVSNTGYLDWYYGLRRLFREGSRPDVVIVTMNARQFMTRSIAGDYAVHSMVDAEDLMKLAADMGASNTEASSLVADRASAFYGTRSDIRTWALQMVLPRFEQVRDLITPPSSELPSDDEIAERIAPRLEALRNVCAEYGARMIILIPPAVSRDGSEGLKRAAALVKIPVLDPYAPGELPANFFSDGFHLNAEGAARFTDRVGQMVRGYFSSTSLGPFKTQYTAGARPLSGPSMISIIAN
jgi:hypothetical protein